MQKTLKIYRGGTESYELDIDERTVFSHTILAEHKVEATFVYHEPLDIVEGDYIVHGGQEFYVNQPPKIQKLNNFTYVYVVNFEHYIYKLYNAVMLHLGDMDFHYYGTARQHLDIVIANINRIDSGWSVGTVVTTEPKHISYGQDAEGLKCRAALTQICEVFKLEFVYSGKQISLVEKAGRDTGVKFKYGMGNGLYSMERLTPDNYNPATKIYLFGGTQNIPAGYRGGRKRLTTSTGFVERTPEAWEQVREDSLKFDDIYPERTGTISAVDGLDKVTDGALDFNVSDNIIGGVVPRILFKSGALQGEELEFSYDNATKTYTLAPLTLPSGEVIPNATFKAAVGDQYTLLGISLPESYVSSAENRLELAGLERLGELNRLPYSCRIDEKYMRDNGITLAAGDRVVVQDEQLGIDEPIRITSISYPICIPKKYTVTISDKILYTKIDREIIERKRENYVIKQNSTQNYELARRQTMRFAQLEEAIFDPEGNFFDPNKIKPFSIQSYMISVGAASQNFVLRRTILSPNYLGNPNVFHISAGELVHFQAQIEGLGYVWDMPEALFSGLDPTKLYYVYAKCSKTVLEGTWQISETPVTVDDPDEPNFWNFNLGVLYAVADGYRDYDLTKGMTYIVGDTITSGKVKDITGQNFFDLTNGTFNLGGTTSGLDFGVTRPNTLTIRGALTQNAGGYESVIPTDRGDYSSIESYYYGDLVQYQGATYKFISETPVAGIVPTNPLYWAVYAAKGATGTDAKNIRLVGDTQIIAELKNGTVTPSTPFQIQVFTEATSITEWSYSVDGGAFITSPPTGVSRSGSIVTINPITSSFKTLAVSASDGTLSDVFTVGRVREGDDGYTVLLTNEAYVFAGTETSAVPTSVTTGVVVYKGGSPITPTSISVGAMPTGMNASVSGANVTFSVTAAMISPAGAVPITIVADGQTFTREFSYSISFKGDAGVSAASVSLNGSTQIISIAKNGTVTPSSAFTVTGSSVNTTINAWRYSVNGGAFNTTQPTGVTRSGNVVTINPNTSTFNTLAISASDGTVTDVFTIARVREGADGYTVLLTNEAHVFAGTPTTAAAGSATTGVVVYKGATAITPTSVSVGATPVGMTATVSGANITFAVTTAMTTAAGKVPITIVADGQTFTRDFSYSISFKGEQGVSAANIVLAGATQVISIAKSGAVTPSANFTVVGTALNTTISAWTYSVNGGSFTTSLPTGVTRSINTVTINPNTSTFITLTIRASDGTISDSFTIARVREGVDGYTVLLTNEAYVFAGTATTAAAGSTTTGVVVYKGATAVTPTDILVGTLPTGMTASVSGSTVTFTVTTAMTTAAGFVDLTIVADGQSFIRRFSYSIAFRGNNGTNGTNGVSVVLSPPSVLIPANASGGSPVLTNAITYLLLYRGTVAMGVNITSISASTGTTATFSGNSVQITGVTLGTQEGWVTIAFTSTDSTYSGTIRWTWALAKQGATGSPGSPGQKGAGLRPRGPYDPTATYVGSTAMQDFVTYAGRTYLARQTVGGNFSGQTPSSGSTYWEDSGADFDFISTKVILADRARIENAIIPFVQTSESGKRIEINELRPRRNSSGTPTSVVDPQNNIAVKNAAGQIVTEIDDDSTPTTGTFYLDFSVPLPTLPGPLDDPFRDWSAYNTPVFRGTDNPAWSHGNFSTGFPPFSYSALYNVLPNTPSPGQTTYRYFFRNRAAGVNVGNPSADYSMIPQPALGAFMSSFRNAAVFGAFSEGHTRVLGGTGDGMNFYLDGGAIIEDHNLVYSSSTNATFTFPRFITSGGIINIDALSVTRLGRVVRFINKGTGGLTLAHTGTGIDVFINQDWTEVSSLIVYPKTTVTLMLISKTSVPTAVSQWRWVVVSVEHNESAPVTPSILFVDENSYLPPNPPDKMTVYVINRMSASYTLSGNGKSVVRYSGAVETSFSFGNHAKKTYVYSAATNRWYEMY